MIAWQVSMLNHATTGTCKNMQICFAFGVAGDELFRSKSHSALPASPLCQSESEGMGQSPYLP